MHPRFPVAVALALVSATGLSAQEHDHQHGTEQLGRVAFPISCKPLAQQRFERAMAMLHSFWWEEAPREFRAALETDPGCAMAHWGLAVNAWGNPFTGGPLGDNLRSGAAAATRAGQLGAPTPRERGFIAAVEALYRDHATVPAGVRMRAYSDTMARVYADHRDDAEVSLYYALSLIATAAPTDTTLSRQKQAAAILDPLFAKHPDHPGMAHYIIHATDSPRLAELGLDAARRYARIAPAAPHAQHMPSHIFIRLGLWEETVASNRRSYEAGLQYARDQGAPGAWYHEFHALDYMTYGYLQEGRDSAARAIVDEGLAIKVIRGPTPLTRSYNRTSMEARLALERGDWEAASKFALTDSATLFNQMLAHFTRGIGAARLGKVAAAREEVTGLERVERALAEGGDAYWSRAAGIKREAVHAWVLLASGDTTGALRAATAAADREDVTEKHPITPCELLPARELEADMHLAIGHFPAARAAYLRVLTRERGRARAMFGAARAAGLAGDKAAAAEGYRRFLEQMREADGTRQEVRTASDAIR